MDNCRKIFSNDKIFLYKLIYTNELELAVMVCIGKQQVIHKKKNQNPNPFIEDKIRRLKSKWSTDLQQQQKQEVTVTER